MIDWILHALMVGFVVVAAVGFVLCIAAGAIDNANRSSWWHD